LEKRGNQIGGTWQAKIYKGSDPVIERGTFGIETKKKSRTKTCRKGVELFGKQGEERRSRGEPEGSKLSPGGFKGRARQD